MKLRDILNEITGTKVKLKDLTFDLVKNSFPNKYQTPNGSDVRPGYKDYVNFPTGGGNLEGISDDVALQRWKRRAIEAYGPDFEITFDPNADAWFDLVRIEDEEYKRKEAEKAQAMSKWYDQLKYKGD